MFDMKRNSGENDGYQLRITYNKQHDRYYVSGFVVFIDPATNRVSFDADGAPIQFPTMEAAIEHIANYLTWWYELN